MLKEQEAELVELRRLSSKSPDKIIGFNGSVQSEGESPSAHRKKSKEDLEAGAMYGQFVDE